MQDDITKAAENDLPPPVGYRFFLQKCKTEGKMQEMGR
jgi:hypothetical protein